MSGVMCISCQCWIRCQGKCIAICPLARTLGRLHFYGQQSGNQTADPKFLRADMFDLFKLITKKRRCNACSSHTSLYVRWQSYVTDIAMPQESIKRPHSYARMHTNGSPKTIVIKRHLVLSTNSLNATPLDTQTFWSIRTWLPRLSC